jgi:hypothetical protein
MKSYLVLIVTSVFFASCLKQSIPDAMLAARRESTGGGTATLSYEVKGVPVQISVPDAANQPPGYRTLSCIKDAGSGYYALSGVSSIGEIAFLFYTDTLILGDYTYNGSYGEQFFTSYNNENQYTVVATDYLTFSITSYENSRISGNFSGQLTPMISDGNGGFEYGPYSSTKITKGVFKNVPVFY